MEPKRAGVLVRADNGSLRKLGTTSFVREHPILEQSRNQISGKALLAAVPGLNL